MRLILQQEATECGLACLAMILNHFKSPVDLTDLRQRFPISTRGTSVAELTTIAKQLQLDPVVYLLKPDQLTTLSLPAIIHWEANHYVVLSKINKQKGYYIADPAKGSYWLPPETVFASFTHIALVLSPAPTFLPVRHRVYDHYKNFINLFSFSAKDILLILCLTLLLQCAVLQFPRYIELLFLPSAARRLSLQQLILILCFYKIGEAALFFIRGLIIACMDKTLARCLSRGLFTHLIHLPLAYFENRSPATILSRFGSLEKIRETANRGLLIGLIDGTFSLLIVVIFFSYSFKLGGILVLLSLVYLLSCHLIHQCTDHYNHLQSNQRATESSLFLDYIRGISTIKTGAHESTSIKRWFNKYASFVNTTFKINMINHILESSRIILFGAIYIATLLIGVQLIEIHLLSAQQLYAIIFYLTIYIKSLTSVTGKFFDLKLCLSYASHLADIAHNNIEKNDTPLPTPSLPTGIKLNNISYRYHPQSEWILRDVCLSIHPNTCVILFGPSGSGKTTLLKIIMGLIPPTSGELHFNQHQISANHLRWYRQKLCSIQQHDHLFAGTLYQNIGFFEEPIDHAKVQECAVIANIHQDIAAMPMGYHSYLGDMGQAISGGQKQRILLARALYKNPSILVLDEAFSNLDIETETKLYRALKKLSITLIVVTHRKETLSIADQVIHLSAIHAKLAS